MISAAATDRHGRRPRVLVTPWRRRLPTYLGEQTLLDAVDPAYCQGIFEAGGLPLTVSRPPGDIDAVARELLALADGLLLTGGGDVDPVSYGAASERVSDADAAADAWELTLLRGARERALPTLAICRGAQLLAVASGGTLEQSPPVTEHHRQLEDLPPDEILGARHPVQVSPGSRLHEALGRDCMLVNTIHHHQIADSGELEITARAPDGEIEAVEAAGQWSAVGVQWHPEKMREPDQALLFAQLVDRARKRPRRPSAADSPVARTQAAP